MKTLAVFGFIAAALVAAHLVIAAGQSDRPSSVAEAHWVPISERFGFVIEPTGPATRAQAGPPYLPALPAELMPPLRGYFVVKTATGWRRLAVVDPAELSKL
ncbi:MAG TPA: hypothetical protein VH814_07340 [Steroidobacteraceae bacterium]|jgi:hypothetical protein